MSPVYDFKCNSCGTEVELTASMGDDSVLPACSCGATMSRVYSAPGVIFKGNGWGSKS